MQRVLVVDDEPINLEIIKETLADENMELVTAANGQEALDQMALDAFDLILLDRMMPVMDGMAVLRTIKAEPAWRDVPVIMQTAAASPTEVREGIEAGAHYYLTKPYDPDALRILTLSILSDVRLRAEAQAASSHFDVFLSQLESAVWRVRTITEATHLASALARLCPDPSLPTTGLTELLINAVEHGNLGIGYEKKSELKWAGTWEAEIERRLADPVLGARTVMVTVRKTFDNIIFTIKDQGEGFNWQNYLEFSTERAFDLHGRGIAMAKALSFTALEYQGKGNTVVATVKRPQPA